MAMTYRNNVTSVCGHYLEADNDMMREVGVRHPMPIRMPSQSSAEGDLHVAELTGFVQARATYNKRPANFREFTEGGGSVSYADREFKATCSGSTGSYGALRSLRSLNYKAGFGASIRFMARFEHGVAGTWQGVGGFNIGDEYSFGYNGTDFGIWHRYGGLAEVQRLTITTPAGGSETADLKLDGMSYLIPLTSGTAAHNAKEIADWLQSNQSTVNGRQNGDTVTIFWQSDGPKTGTMSFSSDGDAAGSLAEITNGVTKTSDFIAQSDWNGETPDGFDPTKYNAYHIEYDGNARFFIEDPATSTYIIAHDLEYLNASTSPPLGDPSLGIGIYSTNVGGHSGVSCYAASLSGFVDGKPARIRNPRGFENTKDISSGTETPLFTVRNVEVINGVANHVEIEPTLLSIANDGGRVAVFRIRGNATLGGESNFQYQNEDNLVSEVDTSASTASGGLLIAAFTLGRNQSKVIDLTNLRIRIPPTISYTVSAELLAGGSADLGASLTWYEDE